MVDEDTFSIPVVCRYAVIVLRSAARESKRVHVVNTCMGDGIEPIGVSTVVVARILFATVFTIFVGTKWFQFPRLCFRDGKRTVVGDVYLIVTCSFFQVDEDYTV